jgi:NUMOD4 motif
MAENPENLLFDVERWCKVEGYERYSVSTHGRVRNDVTQTFRKIRCDTKGYPDVKLFRSGEKPKVFRVHRLMGLAFLKNENNAPQINHRNGIKSSNFLWNIEWCDCRANIRHAFQTGLSSNKHSRRRVSQFTPDGKYVATHESFLAAAAAVGLKTTETISNVVHGRQVTSAGFLWRFADVIKKA